jgi:hypothetical protein
MAYDWFSMSLATTRSMMLLMRINELLNLTHLMSISRLAFNCYEISRRMAYPCIPAHHSRKMSIPTHIRPQVPLARQGLNGATQRLSLVRLVLKLDQQQTAGSTDLQRLTLLLNLQIPMISERPSVVRRHHDSQALGRSSK